MFFLAFGFYWLGFLAVVLPRSQSPSAWRLFYVALGFLVWFDTAVFLVPLIYGEDLAGTGRLVKGPTNPLERAATLMSNQRVWKGNASAP